MKLVGNEEKGYRLVSSFEKTGEKKTQKDEKNEKSKDREKSGGKDSK